MTPIAQSFPIHDWQFWIVTTIFVIAIVFMFRGVLPWTRKKVGGKSTRVSLTVRGKTPEK